MTIFDDDFFRRISRIAFVLCFGLCLSCHGDPNIRMWENPPVEKVPPLTNSLVEYVKSRPIPQSQLESLPNGATQLVIDSQPYSFVFGATPLSDPMDSWHVQTWKQTGHELLHVFANIGFYDPRRGYGNYHTPFWSDKDTYHEEMVETLLWRILRVYPDAKILLTLQIDVYPNWHRENPQELMRNEHNDGFVVGHHFRRIGNDPNMANQEVLAPSFFSKKLLSDESRAVRRFIEKLESTIPGRAVIGYVIGGGQDLQNYMWHPPDGLRQKDPNLWGDYSQPARAAWRQWAKAKYKTIEKLNETWKTNFVDFEDVAPPASTKLIGKEKFHNPCSEQQAIDWKFFLTQGRSDYLLTLAKVVRESASRKIIIGAYSGESGCRSDVEDNWRLLQSKNIDFLFHQPFYGNRLPPSASGISAVLGSHQLNGKLFICDMDHHTWLGKPLGELIAGTGVSQNDRVVGRAQNIEQLRSMWRREIGRLTATGLGWHYHPLHGAHMFEAPSIRQELAMIKTWIDSLDNPSPQNPACDVAVIFDEHSIAYLKGALSLLHWRWWHTQIEKLNASGVPYATYYADDLRAGNLTTAKMVLFINQLNFDPEMIEAIEKLKSDNRTVVFMQYSGLIQYSQGQIDTVSDVIGMNLSTSGKNAQCKGNLELSDSLQKLASSPILPKEKGLILTDEVLAVTDSQAVVLADYADSNIPAFAVCEHDNWTSVFVGTDVLSPTLFHKIAEYAGAWRIAPQGYAVAASEDMLMVHPLKAGPVTITLKEPAALWTCPPETIKTSCDIRHELDLELGKTYLFKLIKEP